jgi:hypothetical protein
MHGDGEHGEEPHGTRKEHDDHPDLGLHPGRPSPILEQEERSRGDEPTRPHDPLLGLGHRNLKHRERGPHQHPEGNDASNVHGLNVPDGSGMGSLAHLGDPEASFATERSAGEPPSPRQPTHGAAVRLRSLLVDRHRFRELRLARGDQDPLPHLNQVDGVSLGEVESVQEFLRNRGACGTCGSSELAASAKALESERTPSVNRRCAVFFASGVRSAADQGYFLSKIHSMAPLGSPDEDPFHAPANLFAWVWQEPLGQLDSEPAAVRSW